MLRSRLIGIVLLAPLFAALPGCAPAFMSNEEIEITGEFRANGSCQAQAAGRSLFDPSDSARTFYKPPIATALPPGGSVAHDIFCKAGHSGSSGSGSLLLQIPVFRLGQPPTGTYTIMRSAALHGSEMTIDGAYFDSRRYGLGTPGAGFGGDAGNVYLAAKKGTVQFTRIDSAGVVGTFRFIAVREWSM